MEDNGTLSQLGIKLSTLIAGFSGGLFHYYLEGAKANQQDKPFFNRLIDSMVSGFMGSIMAVYVTPIALIWFNVPKDQIEVQTGAGFVMGVVGLYIGRGLIKLAKKWSENPHIPPRS